MTLSFIVCTLDSSYNELKKIQKKMVIEYGFSAQSVISMQRYLLVTTGCSLQPNWLSAEPSAISRVLVEIYLCLGNLDVKGIFLKKYVSPSLKEILDPPLMIYFDSVRLCLHGTFIEEGQNYDQSMSVKGHNIFVAIHL